MSTGVSIAILKLRAPRSFLRGIPSTVKSLSGLSACVFSYLSRVDGSKSSEAVRINPLSAGVPIVTAKVIAASRRLLRFILFSVIPFAGFKPGADM